ncbi:MAG: lysophospholipid acyltransferase family protein [Candidatus Binatia bacterium]
MLIIALTVILATIATFAGLLDPHGKVVYRINRFWTWAILFAGGVKLKVTGSEKLNSRQQYIFMVNHQSNVDIPILLQSLPRFQLRWIAKKELVWVPFFGWAMWATKHITVDRTNPLSAVKSLRRAKERIAAGISVVVFPEGTRSRDGHLQRFKKGGFLLAVQTHTEIVPITIKGSRDLLPSGAWRLRSGTVEVVIDQPVSIAGYRPGNLRLLSDQVRETIAGHLRQSGRANSSAAEAAQPLLSDGSLEKQQI